MTPSSMEEYRHTTSGDDIDTNSAGFVLLVVAGVLGCVAMILGLLYAYIYCTKIKPQRRALVEDRISYYGREHCIQYGGQIDKEQTERSTIKTHPFFVLSYLSRLKPNGHDSQVASTSNKR